MIAWLISVLLVLPHLCEVSCVDKYPYLQINRFHRKPHSDASEFNLHCGWTHMARGRVRCAMVCTESVLCGAYVYTGVYCLTCFSQDVPYPDGMTADNVEGLQHYLRYLDDSKYIFYQTFVNLDTVTKIYSNPRHELHLMKHIYKKIAIYTMYHGIWQSSRIWPRSRFHG